MAKKPSFLYPMITVALFFIVLAILALPTIRLSTLNQLSIVDTERPLVSWGTTSFTTGDFIAMFSLLAASVDVATLLFLLRRQKMR